MSNSQARSSERLFKQKAMARPAPGFGLRSTEVYLAHEVDHELERLRALLAGYFAVSTAEELADWTRRARNEVEDRE